MMRNLAFFACIAVIALVLAGCAGDNGTDTNGKMNQTNAGMANGTANLTNETNSAGINKTNSANVNKTNGTMNANITNLANKTNITANNGANETNETNLTNNAPPSQTNVEVVMDFLYADWCGHCTAMKPVVEELQASLPKERFAVRWWNEKYAQNSPEVAAIYQNYLQKGFFQGFPTFVINGEHPLVGSMPAPAFKEWVCTYFEEPKPQYCLAA